MTMTWNKKDAFRLAIVLFTIGAGTTVYVSYPVDATLAAFAVGLIFLLIATYFLLGSVRFFLPPS
jgi:hypothetical protein